MNTLTSTSNIGSSSSNKRYVSKPTTITQGSLIKANEEVPLMYKYYKRRLEREEKKKRESKEEEEVVNKEDVNDKEEMQEE